MNLYYCEHLIFTAAISRCKFPVDHKMFEQPHEDGAAKVIILSDVRLKPIRVSPWVDPFVRAWLMVTDAPKRRTFQRLHHLQPTHVLFLGDIFDSAAEWSKSEYLYMVNRFRKTFATSEEVRAFYVPGDNDIGTIHMKHMAIQILSTTHRQRGRSK